MLDFYLQKEEIEDLQFQNDILVAPTAHTPRKPQHIPYISSSIERQIWRRNASIAREALQEAHYLCEINNKHLTFKSNITNENFVEAHHLIPIKFQNYFSWSLDVPGNIVSLCPNCHRKIHHANKKERKIILKFLYKKYKNALSDYDILVPLDNIYKFYEC
ncbi:HNH endonuclease [Priestia megaterium]|nr:HNH endonuclease [Priestia megaterium]